MVSEEIKQICDTISKQGKMSFLEATAEDIIVAFEKGNDITLPARYKEWLQLSDGGEFFLPAGIQLYGVAHKPVIDVNNDSRPNEKYIVIGALASGDPILCENGSEKISIYNQEADRIEDDEVYDDFVAFLKDLYDLLGIGG